MREPVWILPGSRPRFPDPRRADADGLLAVGGDLSVARLRLAYRSGIFPWYDASTPPLWWSPDPRAVLTPDSLHVPRRLERTLRGGRFTLSHDRAFRAVIEACAHRPGHGTWLVPEMIDAYVALHAAGDAHSIEVWNGESLVGGVYGVQVGAVFAAESKFHRATDMSKVALVALARSFFAAGGELIDVQFRTEHLTQFGVREMRRIDYLARIADLAARRVDIGSPHFGPGGDGKP